MEMAIMCFICLCTGWALCYVTMRRGTAESKQEDPRDIMVKRTKMSMRSPLRTTRTDYDKYKSNGSDLYAPVKPKGENKDTVEVGR